VKRFALWFPLLPLIASTAWGDFVDDGSARYRQGDWDGAITNFTQAIEQAPASFVAYYDRGLAKKAKADFAGAIADYTKAIELKPDHPNYYLNRGNAEAAKGDLDAAIADYNQAIELKADYADAYLSRGGSRSTKGDTEGALADYAIAIKLKPAFWRAYLYRANVECKSSGMIDNWEIPLVAAEAVDKMDAALADYSQAIEINANLTEAYYYRGFIWFLKSRLDQGNADPANSKSKSYLAAAAADFTKITELEPTNANAFCFLGIIKRAQNDPAAGLADFNQAIQLDPHNLKALFNRGRARLEQPDLDGAFADFCQAKALNPGRNWVAQLNASLSFIYCAHAKDKWLKDDADGAFSDLNQALELDPANAEAYHNRGLIEQHKRDLKNAVADYSKSLELDPGNLALADTIKKLKKYLENH